MITLLQRGCHRMRIHPTQNTHDYRTVCTATRPSLIALQGILRQPLRKLDVSQASRLMGLVLVPRANVDMPTFAVFDSDAIAHVSLLISVAHLHLDSSPVTCDAESCGRMYCKINGVAGLRLNLECVVS